MSGPYVIKLPKIQNARIYTLKIKRASNIHVGLFQRIATLNPFSSKPILQFFAPCDQYGNYHPRFHYNTLSKFKSVSIFIVKFNPEIELDADQ